MSAKPHSLPTRSPIHAPRTTKTLTALPGLRRFSDYTGTCEEPDLPTKIPDTATTMLK